MRKIREITHFSTDWMQLIGELLEDGEGKTLDYWRVEKADSVIIIPHTQGRLVAPGIYHRPGIGETTYDFPGGRIKEGEAPRDAAERILRKELAIEHIRSLTSFTPAFYINSSFSDQKLYGFTADVSGDLPTEEAQEVLKKLDCLQCRCLLLEWMSQQ